MTWTLRPSTVPDIEAGRGNRWSAHRPRTHGVAWLDHGRLLSWGADWHLRLWDARTQVELGHYTDPARRQSGDGGIGGAIPLDDGRVLSWSHDGVVNLWDLAQSAPLARVELGSRSVVGVRRVDARRFVSWAADGVVALWTLDPLASRTLPWRPIHEDALSRVAPFIVDGDRGLIAWRLGTLSYVAFATDVAPVVAEPFAALVNDADDDENEDDEIVAVVRLTSGNVVVFARAGHVSEWTVPDLRRVAEYRPLPVAARGAVAYGTDGFAAWYAGRMVVHQAGQPEPVFVLDSAEDVVVEAVALDAGALAYRTLGRHVVGWDGEERWRCSTPAGREPLAMQSVGSEVVLWSFADGDVAVGGPLGAGLLATDGGGIDLVAPHSSWPAKRVVAAAMANGDLCVGEVVLATSPQASSTVRGAVRHVASDGRRIVACSQAGPVTVHDAADGATRRELAGTERGGCGVIDGILLDGDRMIGWEGAGSIYAWSLDTGQLIGVLDENDVGPQGRVLALGDRVAVSWSPLRDVSGFLLWELDGLTPLAALEHPGPALGAARVGDEVVTWVEGTSLRRWTLDGTLTETVDLEHTLDGGIHVADTLVAWTDRGDGLLWRTGEALVVQRLEGGDAPITKVSGGDGEVLFCRMDGTLVVWSIEDRRQRVLAHRTTGGVAHAARTADGWVVVDQHGTLATVSRGGEIRDTRIRVRDPHVAMTPAGRTLVAGSARTLVMIDLASMRSESVTLPSRLQAVAAVDDGCVAVGLGDGSVRVVARAAAAAER